MSDAPILTVQDLCHYYRSRGLLRTRRASEPAVESVTFAVQRRETFGIVGESGSGKTTMARIVSGLCRQTSGVVQYEGRDVYGTDDDARWLYKKVQIVLQDPYSSLNPRARVAKILARPLLLHGVPRERRPGRVAELLTRVGLDAEIGARFPAELSGGQRQRVAIARALAGEPDLLVLDEPTSALDVSTQGQIINLLRDLQRQLDLTYVFVSHNLALVAYLCDRMLVMHRGHAVEMGGAVQLYREPQHEYTKELMSAVVTPRPRKRDDAPTPAGPPPVGPQPS